MHLQTYNCGLSERVPLKDPVTHKVTRYQRVANHRVVRFDELCDFLFENADKTAREILAEIE